MSARDLARIGQLMLQRGRWSGRQVMPAASIEEITRPHSRVTPPDGSPMPGVGYGMTWWVPAPESHGVTLGAGAFEALGTGTQLLLVAPALDLVYAHRNDTDVAESEYRAVSTEEAYGVLELLLEGVGS